MKIVELPKERRQAALGTAEKSFEQSGWKTCPMVTPVGCAVAFRQPSLSATPKELATMRKVLHDRRLKKVDPAASCLRWT